MFDHQTYLCYANNPTKDYSHYCNGKMFLSPIEDWDVEITAGTKEEAIKEAWPILKKHIKNFLERYKHWCECGEFNGKLKPTWYETLKIVAFKLPVTTQERKDQ